MLWLQWKAGGTFQWEIEIEGIERELIKCVAMV